MKDFNFFQCGVLQALVPLLESSTPEIASEACNAICKGLLREAPTDVLIKVHYELFGMHRGNWVSQDLSVELLQILHENGFFIQKLIEKLVARFYYTYVNPMLLQ